MKIKLVGKPKDAPYLTPGKVYEATPYGDHSATFTDDEGEELTALLPGSVCPCLHARPAKWEIVE